MQKGSTMKAFRLTTTQGATVACQMTTKGNRFGIFAVSDDLCVAHGYAYASNGAIVVEMVETHPTFNIETVELEFQQILNDAA